jgi:hypothetical protein
MRILFVDDAGVQRSFEADATLRIQHDLTSTVTRRPVEKGADLTDNVRPEPATITAELEVTNTPIEIPEGSSGVFLPLRLERQYREITQTARVKGGPGTRIQFSLIEVEIGNRPVEITPAQDRTVTESAGMQTLQFPTAFDRVKDTLDLFDRLRLKAIQCTCVTALRTYENMQVARISVPEEPRDAATFSVEFQQIRIGSTNTVEVVPVAERRAEKKKAKGAQAGYKLPEEQESLASKLFSSPDDAEQSE